MLEIQFTVCAQTHTHTFVASWMLDLMTWDWHSAAYTYKIYVVQHTIEYVFENAWYIKTVAPLYTFPPPQPLHKTIEKGTERVCVWEIESDESLSIAHNFAPWYINITLNLKYLFAHYTYRSGRHFQYQSLALFHSSSSDTRLPQFCSLQCLFVVVSTLFFIRRSRITHRQRWLRRWRWWWWRQWWRRARDRIL